MQPGNAVGERAEGCDLMARDAQILIEGRAPVHTVEPSIPRDWDG